MSTRKMQAWIEIPSILLLSFTIAGCSVSVRTEAYADGGAYKAAWQSGWEPVIQDSAPWMASGSSPGVCDKGGDARGCFDTDRYVAAGLQALLDKLNNVSIPPEYTQATNTLKQAIELDIQ